jgi:LPS sulfotransferase NodH
MAHPDMSDPAFDQENPEGTRPKVSFIVCSTPRSGSSLLAEGMWASKAMGIPMEYFNQALLPLLSSRWGSVSLADYLENLVARRTDRTGAFGIKTHWAQLVQFHEKFRFEQGMPPLPAVSDSIFYRDLHRFLSGAFPNTRYIHIIRLNRIRQAVSWYVGSITGEWVCRENQTVEENPCLPYDFNVIHRYLIALDVAEACWREFFRINGIRPITLVYEDFEYRYAEGMADLMETLGLPAVADFPLPGIKRQANETTEVLVRQITRDLSPAADQL